MQKSREKRSEGPVRAPRMVSVHMLLRNQPHQRAVAGQGLLGGIRDLRRRAVYVVGSAWAARIHGKAQAKMHCIGLATGILRVGDLPSGVGKRDTLAAIRRLGVRQNSGLECTKRARATAFTLTAPYPHFRRAPHTVLAIVR